MNLEGLTLHILTNKLKEELLGGKIYKVFMPSYESLLLLVKRERDTAALLADFSCGSPMLYLPNNLPERPESPPAFWYAAAQASGRRPYNQNRAKRSGSYHYHRY